MAALPDVVSAIQASLQMVLASDGSTPDAYACVPIDELNETDLHRLAGRAIHLSSALETSAHRSLLFIGRALALSMAPSLSPADGEVVEAGWQSARTLYRAVLGRLPESLQPSTAPAKSDKIAAREARIDAVLDMSFPASDPPSWMP